MAETAKRKSVSFAENSDVVDANGDVLEPKTTTGDKETAESHAMGKDDEVDDITAMFEGLAKKKKKKPKKAEGGEEKEEDEAADEVDLSALKKKKKSKKKAVEDFDAKLEEAGEGQKGDEETNGGQAEEGLQDGDIMEGVLCLHLPRSDLVKLICDSLALGTGVWAHDASTPITYPSLLSRFFILLHDRHPDLASSGSKNYKIPPPQCLREGNKKTIFANIADICKRMKRTDEHVTQFLFAELGTSGSVDGSRRLVIKGRFQQKQIENVLRRYIMEYVTCKTCRSPDTQLNKGENRLYFVTCNSCGSRRSVTAIRTGFSAQVGKRKRMQK